MTMSSDTKNDDDDGNHVEIRASQVINKKKSKEKIFSVGSLFSFAVQATPTSKPAVVEIPANVTLTLTTACTNKVGNLRLYVSSSTNDDDNDNDDFLCIGTFMKQKAMTNIGIQVSDKSSLKLKAEQFHTTRGTDTSSIPLAINIFGTIQPSFSSSSNHNEEVSSKNKSLSTGIEKDEKMIIVTTTTTKKDNDKTTKKRKLSQDDNKTIPSNDDKEEEEAVGDDNNNSQSPIKKITKRQRKKLAKQKVLELERVLHGDTATQKKLVTTSPKQQKPKQHSLTKERRLEGGLLVRDILIGTGSLAAKPGKKVSIHYEGTIAETGKVFDKNQSKSNPLDFRVGTGQVIKGLERGLDGMRAGGERMFTIPPNLGYGKKGSGDVIPKNATLCFTVKLLSVGAGK